ncbi:hypothetical protein FBZ83_12344 [Azospirillum brasilense]|uniref:Peptidase C-terminal archaeal/bacterial domain-containing protein n=1 Tax=Azospirillum brasilense TaxID=192 RepID=A0A560BSM5_AZOBR|nr:hypothetical protein FBZ83_12344 [Azospirillum brasilense]
MARNPYWSDNLATQVRRLEAWQHPDAHVSFAKSSSTFYENDGGARGSFTSTETLDFVTVNLSTNAEYTFVGVGTYQVSINLYDSGGYLLLTVDGDDIGYRDPYRADSIVQFRPDAPGTYYLSISNSYTAGSGDWGLGVAEDIGGDEKNSGPAAPSVSVTMKRTVGGVTEDVRVAAYDGPVPGLQWTFLGDARNEVLGGSDGNDFINLLGGDDAATGGAGDDVLDGGSGSNWLVGGAGKDTFFVDGRGGVTTWSTVTDLERGELSTLWGYKEGVSKLSWEEIGGASGYNGATVHCDIDGNGTIDASMTFSGKTVGAMTFSTGTTADANSYVAFFQA